MNNFPKVTVTTNSLGLRNRELQDPKPQDTTRILFLGDSMTMGVGVEEPQTFPRLIETELNATKQPNKIEIVNASLMGSDPDQYYLYLKNEGLKLSPDIVVVNLFIYNDIYNADNQNGYPEIDSGGLPITVTSLSHKIENGVIVPKEVPLKYKFPVLNKSMLFSLAIDTLIPKQKNLYNRAFIKERLCLFQASCTLLNSQKNHLKAILLGIKKLTHEHGMQLLVNLIPAEFQAYYDQPTRIKHLIVIPFNPESLELPNKELGDFLKSESITYVDLLPIFRKHNEEQTYFPLDGHFNTLGHQIAASALLQNILPLITNQNAQTNN